VNKGFFPYEISRFLLIYGDPHTKRVKVGGMYGWAVAYRAYLYVYERVLIVGVEITRNKQSILRLTNNVRLVTFGAPPFSQCCRLRQEPEAEANST
jgi:hypothetical protein